MARGNTGGTDRSAIASVLDRARRVALEIDTRTSLVPLPPPPAPPDEAQQRMAIYDAMVTDGALRDATRKLFEDGSYADAVGKAFTVVNNRVKKRCKSTRDGVKLMNHAFSEDAPVLAITRRKTESEQNEHNGYRAIFGGAMLGIRNPHHHEHDLRDESAPALEMLALANHLLRVTDRATRRRVPMKVATPVAPRQDRSKPGR